MRVYPAWRPTRRSSPRPCESPRPPCPRPGPVTEPTRSGSKPMTASELRELRDLVDPGADGARHARRPRRSSMAQPPPWASSARRLADVAGGRSPGAAG
jgi:hypothetical protein